MKKKIIMISFGCVFLLISGICYSCSYQKNSDGFSSTLEKRKEENADQKESNEVSEHSINTDPQSKNANLMNRDNDLEKQSSEKDAEQITVHVCGAVTDPGVYQMAFDMRLVDAIALAGGLTEEAAGDYINQAQPVKDGQRVYIPTLEEIKEISASEYIKGETPVSEDSTESGSKLVNINQADAALLMTIPGIGQAKANSIIEYRNTNGTFQSIEEIMRIPGIKEGLFQKISPYITI